MKPILTLILASALSITAFAKELALPSGLGHVHLPPRFDYEAKQGNDSIVGSFKKGSATVDFDFGPMAGVYVDTMRDHWKNDASVSIVRDIETDIHGNTIKILIYQRGEKRGAIASYPEYLGNFYCDYIDDGDLSDFLLLALSFEGTKKISNKAVDSTATRVTPPAEQEPRHGQP